MKLIKKVKQFTINLGKLVNKFNANLDHNIKKH